MKDFFYHSKLLTLFKVFIQSNEIILVKKLSMTNLQFTALSSSISFQPFFYLFIHLYIFIQLDIIAYV